MPSVPIYIRKEDFKKWEAIDNKSQWLHDALNGSYKVQKDPTVQHTEILPLKEKKPTTSVGVSSPEQEGAQFCKHNAVKGFCKKGCK